MMTSEDIPSDADTIPVNDISQFPDRGSIAVGDEVMTYDGKDEIKGGNPADDAVPRPGRLLSVERGVAGTTAAEHPRGSAVILLAEATPLPRCVGDCDGNDRVTVDEVVTGVNIALGTSDVGACRAADGDGSQTVTVNELVTGVNSLLYDDCLDLS